MDRLITRSVRGRALRAAGGGSDDLLGLVAYVNNFDVPGAGLSDQGPAGQAATAAAGTPLVTSDIPFDAGPSLYMPSDMRVGFTGTAGTDGLSISDVTIDFCYEGWFHPTDATRDTQGLFAKRDGASAEEFGVYFRGLSGGRIDAVAFRAGGATSQITTTVGTVPINTWHHYAWARARVAGVNNYYLYLNGVLVGSDLNRPLAPDLNAQDAYLGDDIFGAGRHFYGALGPHRFTRGSRRYFANFTPARSFPIN